MNIQFEAQKGKRIKHNFFGFEAVYSDWNWNITLNRWELNTEEGYSYTTHRPCRSVKAFKRLLHNAPKGVEFKLWNKYQSRNVYGFGNL